MINKQKYKKSTIIILVGAVQLAVVILAMIGIFLSYKYYGHVEDTRELEAENAGYTKMESGKFLDISPYYIDGKEYKIICFEESVFLKGTHERLFLVNPDIIIYDSLEENEEFKLYYKEDIEFILEEPLEYKDYSSNIEVTTAEAYSIQGRTSAKVGEVFLLSFLFTLTPSTLIFLICTIIFAIIKKKENKNQTPIINNYE